MTALARAIRSGHPPSLFAALVFFDVSFMLWVLIGALGLYIASDLGLSATEKGLVVAIPLLGGAGFRIVVGLLVDRAGPKTVGLASLALLVVPLAWGTRAESFGELTAIGLLLGVAGASFAVALPLVSRWYPPEHQGVALGIAGAGNSGTVVAVLLAPRLAEWVGWRGVFGVALLLLVATFAVFALCAREAPQARRAPGATRALLVEPDLWWFNAFYSVTFGGFVGLASFLSIFFHDQFGVDRLTAGSLTAVCVFAGSFFRPVGGWVSDRLGGGRLLQWLLCSATALFVLLSLLPPLVWSVGLLFGAMLCLGMANGALFQIVPQRVGGQIGLATGVIGAAGGLGGFLLPSMLGLLRDLTGGFRAGLLAYATVVVACWLALCLKRADWEPAAPAVEPGGGRVRMEVVFGG